MYTCIVLSIMYHKPDIHQYKECLLTMSRNECQWALRKLMHTKVCIGPDNAYFPSLMYGFIMQQVDYMKAEKGHVFHNVSVPLFYYSYLNIQHAITNVALHVLLMGQSLLHTWYRLVVGTQPTAADFELLTH